MLWHLEPGVILYVQSIGAEKVDFELWTFEVLAYPLPFPEGSIISNCNKINLLSKHLKIPLWFPYNPGRFT